MSEEERKQWGKRWQRGEEKSRHLDQKWLLNMVVVQGLGKEMPKWSDSREGSDGGPRSFRWQPIASRLWMGFHMSGPASDRCHWNSSNSPLISRWCRDRGGEGRYSEVKDKEERRWREWIFIYCLLSVMQDFFCALLFSVSVHVFAHGITVNLTLYIFVPESALSLLPLHFLQDAVTMMRMCSWHE